MIWFWVMQTTLVHFFQWFFGFIELVGGRSVARLSFLFVWGHV